MTSSGPGFASIAPRHSFPLVGGENGYETSEGDDM